MIWSNVDSCNRNDVISVNTVVKKNKYNYSTKERENWGGGEGFYSIKRKRGVYNFHFIRSKIRYRNFVKIVGIPDLLKNYEEARV